jgi:hypothetical protein
MKRAICFGINNYPGEENDLSGCINDANDWAAKLTLSGFQVTKYLDDQVTKDRFLSAIRSLLAVSLVGDWLVITYSGHGTQAYDTSGDEMDHYDEALYLWDGILIDDEIRAILDTALYGINIVFVLDSCFSGSGTRKPRLIGTYVRPRFVATTFVPASAKARKKFLAEEVMVELLFAGCNDDEYSYDAYINGRYNGAFTYHALKAWKPGMTFNDVEAGMNNIFPFATYPQHPHLEGPAAMRNKSWDRIDPVPEPEPEPEIPIEPDIPMPGAPWWVAVLAGIAIIAAMAIIMKWC